MTVTEFEDSPLEELERDQENGLIVENGARIVSFRLGTLQALVDRLLNVGGERVGTVLLFQVGKEVGEAGYRYSKDEIHSLDDARSALDRILQHRGWGRCVSLEEQGSGSYVFTVKNCPLCDGRKSPHPICHMMRGIVTGWLESHLNKKARDTKESGCAAVNGKECIYEIQFL